MSFLWNVLRVYSWIYEAVLCALAIAVAVAVILSGSETLRVGWLPWTEGHLLIAMLLFAAAGIFSLVLAMRGKLRILLFLFSIYAAYLLVSGLFLNVSYRFTGPLEARNALVVTIGALLAVIGAVPLTMQRERRGVGSLSSTIR